jgi:hypothetical protein
MKDLKPNKVKIIYKDGKKEEFETEDWWTIASGALIALKLINELEGYNYYAIPTADVAVMYIDAEEVEDDSFRL